MDNPSSSSEGDSLVGNHEEDANEEGESERCSQYEAGSHLVKQYIGSGFLAFPWVFAKTGAVTGTLIVILQMAFIELGARILIWDVDTVRTFRKTRVATYEDIAENILGKFGFSLSVCMVCIEKVGTAASYFVFVGRTTSELLGVVSLQSWMFLSFPVVLVLGLIPNYKRLSFVSEAGNVLMAVVFTALMGFSIWKIYSADGEYIQTDANFKDDDVLQSVGIVFFAMAPTFQVVPIQAEMAHRHEFGSVFTSTLLLVGCLYLAFGLLGAFAYGDSTKDIFTLNLASRENHGDAFGVMINSLVLVNIFLTFPAQMLPMNLAITRTVYGHTEPPPWAFVAIRTANLAAGLLLAVSIPHFGSILSFVGVLSAGVIGGILPAVFFWDLAKERTAAYWELISERYGCGLFEGVDAWTYGVAGYGAVACCLTIMVAISVICRDI